MKKPLKTIIPLLFALVLIIGFSVTYSKYISSLTGSVDLNVAKWNITVNGCNIVNPNDQNNNPKCFSTIVNDANETVITKNFNIEDFTYSSNGNLDVVPNKIAPGSSGTFKIAIEPNDTEVSIKYKLKIGLKKPNSSIKLFRSDPNDFTKKIPMEENGYEGLINYSQDGFYFINKNNEKVNASKIEFIIYVEWINDEKNNDKDTELGTSSNVPLLELPTTIEFNQYTGI